MMDDDFEWANRREQKKKEKKMEEKQYTHLCFM